jgi:hypothetical protein
MTTIAERVAKGAQFLDQHDPEWWRADVDRAIDLNRLHLSSAQRCILGQRCPLETLNAVGESPYLSMAMRLSGQERRYLIADWASERGFEVSGDLLDLSSDDDTDEATDEEYAALTAEWRRVITERRTAA